MRADISADLSGGGREVLIQCQCQTNSQISHYDSGESGLVQVLGETG